MKIVLILAALAAALPLKAQVNVVAQEDRAALRRVEALASDWQSWRLRANTAEQTFRRNAPADTIAHFDIHYPEIIAFLRDVDLWHDSKLASWRAQTAAGTMTRDEYNRRAGYIERLHRIYLLQYYGSRIPRVIDVTIIGLAGNPIGHVLAGPSWGIAATYDDFTLAYNALRAESGLGADAYPRP